jgi:hypothetical protein
MINLDSVMDQWQKPDTVHGPTPLLYPRYYYPVLVRPDPKVNNFAFYRPQTSGPRAGWIRYVAPKLVPLTSGE